MLVSRFSITAVLSVLIAITIGNSAMTVVADDKVDFSRDVLPILSDKCFVCHGPDGAKASELRLDSFAAATADLGGYQALTPHRVDQSEMIARINDKEDPMPPADAEKQLTAADREILKKWIEQGGEYASHWAYVPPVKTPGEIDEFIAARFPKGLDFAPEAARETLARRVALVLTGLPPELNELEEFLADSSPGAYERYVNRMLDDPQYGEQQARFWLDAVRYGDTHGLHLDNRRGIYPYRDWVIRSFNRNQPFDQFLKWQLAGDLLPNPTLEQQVATGFVRMNPTTSEGGVIPAEFQAKNNFDRVETLGTTLLGATFVCARCHTHKYDPITHTEYFQLLAFFNSTAESPLDGNAYAYGPVVSVPKDISAWEKWEAASNEVEQFLNRVEPEKESLKRLAGEQVPWKASNWKWSKPLAINSQPEEIVWEDAKGLPGSRGRLPGENQARWVKFELTTTGERQLVMQFNCGPGSTVWLNETRISNDKRIIALSLSPGKSTVRLKLVGSPNRLPLKILLTDPAQELTTDKSWTELGVEDRLMLLSIPELQLAGEPDRKQAGDYLRQLLAMRESFTTTLIARELAKPRVTRLLDRGEYDLPKGEPLHPGVPTVMGKLDDGLPANRLGLAEWLISDENPLVARVLVNRFWQQVFGEGLVRTPEDFGLQGEQPTHPELLDTLAVEFRESGWNVKQLLKRMLMSRTFRQNSRLRSEVRDPNNRLFARGPGYRLDAEVIRDVALWASGLLDPKMGGEGVKPYQPPGMWKALMHPASNTKQYVPDADNRQFRRSVYIYWKRTSPHPTMTLFDAPNRESSCVRRSRSTTPLQSLGLFNEPQRTKAGQALAARALKQYSTDRERLEFFFRLLASRLPSVQEQEVCLGLLEQMKERYSKTVSDAEALTGQENPELAAWAQVAMTLMASDLTIRLN